MNLCKVLVMNQCGFSWDQTCQHSKKSHVEEYYYLKDTLLSTYILNVRSVHRSLLRLSDIKVWGSLDLDIWMTIGRKVPTFLVVYKVTF